MHKLVTVLLATTALAGCAGDSAQQPDWRLNGGCEKYFSVSSREYADCKAFVKSEEAKKSGAPASGSAKANANSSVSLDPQGIYYKEDQGEKVNRDTDRTLTN